MSAHSPTPADPAGRRSHLSNHVVCLALPQSLSRSGFKLRCLRENDTCGLTTESGARSAEAASSTVDESRGAWIARITSAPAPYAHLEGLALAQLGKTTVRGHSAEDLRAAIVEGDKAPPPILVVLTRGASTQQDRSILSIRGSQASAANKKRSGFVWVPEGLLNCPSPRDHGEGDVPTKSCQSLPRKLLQWVLLPCQPPGGPFLHDYIQRCDYEQRTLALPRAATEIGAPSPTEPGCLISAPPVFDEPRSSSHAQSSGCRPTGLLFHCSRCGSTLVANALRAWARERNANAVVSEPGALNDVLVRRLTNWSSGDAQMVADVAIATVLSSLGGNWDTLGSKPTAYIVKTSSWNIFGVDILLNACSQASVDGASPMCVEGGVPRSSCPWVYLYRDPLEVAMSELFHEGGWLRLGRSQPKIVQKLLARSKKSFALPEVDKPADRQKLQDPPSLDTDVAILSEMIASYFEAALLALRASPNAWVLNYSDIVDQPEAALSAVYRVLTGTNPPGPVDPEVLGQYSKSTGQRDHTDDRTRKHAAAKDVPGLADAIETRCYDVYLQLQIHDRRLLHS